MLCNFSAPFTFLQPFLDFGYYPTHVTQGVPSDILKLMGGGHDRMAVGFTTFDMENIKLTTFDSPSKL